ncbi:cell wall metabolism sensor histidine kinase WalK [Cerasibacillus terrae]|uniref:histidine kinase n=1 Tax=Cerasibacillus terrae TaxID=2498845 RepID=A0A5C8NQ51_9BACI|nr:cell wall metabolism sensor histidine kinase WalK [Cerasibacillus terrae]TXL63368.1 cell wall metabolism sensor histidine kinase WalK [Cerasibacillus terrae]
MHKVGFFRSIQSKFTVIYILLLLVAVQVIGAYFASQLETELTTNFKSSVNDRIELLSYNLEQAFKKDRSNDEPTLQQEIQTIVSDIDTKDIMTLEVVNNQRRVLGSNDTVNNSEIIGKKSTREIVQKAIYGSKPEDTLYDPKTESRVFVKAVPIYGEDNQVVGAIYIESSMEGVYSQLQNINEIFFKGSVLAIAVSAFLGILVARTITKPIKEMRRQAQTIARGDFTQKVNVYGTDEIGQLAVSFNNMTDQLRFSYATVEKEQRKMSLVLSNMTDGVIATNENGVITLMNKAAGILIGKSPEECHGRSLLNIIQLDESTLDMTALTESDSMIIDFGKDEIDYLIRATFSTILDDKDNVTGYITVLSDVTEEENLERERREFVSNVSHELRTPLTTMRSYLEALGDGAWKDENIAPRFLDVTQNETERMIRMVNDLLQLSKMDHKDFRLERERTNFTNYFHYVIDRFEMNTPEHITLVRKIPNGKFFVWIDRDRMMQVLDNLISNAIKYSPEGGVVTLKVVKQKQGLLVSISDQGVGIAYEKIDKIFERFYRADQARSRKLGGSGLGLAISRELIEAHKGRIWARSSEGKGTTIYFTLPLMPLMGRMRRVPYED